ncbi:hypothetical protein GALMADRAFT_1274136 [Galerina marginata CBS 339.88]|uniref:Uncharacterized protein n=1 Tax=Galerina marginata (strain CBS 339.88) TaxID=685588 RepID=A0A067T6U6_GALM3|nr:hypothetical protein GALMADRAFT_1274136 [Galerina marginata CBS 339.88]
MPRVIGDGNKRITPPPHSPPAKINLALPTTTKSQKPGLAAKVGALIRFRRAARRHTDPETDTPPAQQQQQQQRQSLNIVPDSVPILAASPASSIVQSPSQQEPTITLPNAADDLSPNPMHPSAHHPPTKQNLKAWWSHFTLNPKPKQRDILEGPYKGPESSLHSPRLILTYSHSP